MAKIKPQFVTRHYEGFGGNFVDSDLLATAYDAMQPHKFEQLMGQIFSASDRFSNKPLLGMTLAKGKYEEVDNEIYRWKLVSGAEKKLVVVENLEAGNATPGIAKSIFKVKLSEDWCAEPDVLFPENNNFPLEIVGEPDPDGDGYIYSMRIQTDDESLFLPPELLEEGREFTKVWTSIASEFNEIRGGQQTESIYELESQLGYFGQELTVTDKLMRNQGRLGINVPVIKGGKVATVEAFLPYYVAKMNDELYQSIEAQLMFGHKSTSPGPKGYWKKTGPGLRQLLAEGWIEYYNGVLTETLLREYLMDIFVSRVSEDNRSVVAMTGTGGSLVFHDMLTNASSGFFQIDTNWIRVEQDSPRLLAFGAQFTRYQGPEGLDVTIIKNPMYDSFKYCPQPAPFNKKLPADSYRFTFLDFGKSDGMDNISFVKEKQSYTYGYVPGTWTPTGPVQGGATSSGIAGCYFFTTGSAGIWMKDVTRGGEIILETE